MKVLELFSGIGGMHFALKDSLIEADVIAAADINPVANEVYKHNFPNVTILQNNIQSFSANFINKISPNIILMSPPCQPFTRVGLQKDIDDKRSCALLHFISILPEIRDSLRFILLENVKGFETSETRNCLIKALELSSFIYQEFLLSPIQLGIPNSRERYYLIAKRSPGKFCFLIKDSVNLQLPETDVTCKCKKDVTEKCIQDVLEFSDEEDMYNEYLINDNNLRKRAWLYDIVHKDNMRSCCFTKSYTSYAEGTGSIYCPLSLEKVKEVYESSKKYETGSVEYVQVLRTLRLRYFSPREVANLMCFPNNFSFPCSLTNKQKYKLLGNSVCVRVISHLITLMLHEPDSD